MSFALLRYFSDVWKAFGSSTYETFENSAYVDYVEKLVPECTNSRNLNIETSTKKDSDGIDL